MPNWCWNELTIEGEAKDVSAFVEQANGMRQVYEEQRDGDDGKDEETSVLSFHQIVPVPESILQQPYSPFGYYAEYVLWGVKWGAIGADITDESDDFVIYNFSTPWCPPEAFMIRASRVFPKLSFHLKYEESGYDLYGRMSVCEGKIESVAELQDISLDGEDAALALTTERLNDPLHMVRLLYDEFGGHKGAEHFVKSLDPSLSL